MSEPDTFDKLIADLRLVRGNDDEFTDVYADRLEALVDEIEPVLLPTFGSVGVHPEDDPPIYRELMGKSEDPDSSPVTGNGSPDAT